MNKRRAIHDRVLQADSPAELGRAYAQWAEDYDADLVQRMGYAAPGVAAAQLQALVRDRDARILDAGCGTGLVGEALHALGYRALIGLDYSEAMLEQARRKAVYRSVHQGDLMARLDFEDAAFDAVICVGTFTLGHIGPSAFGELLRVVRPGGHLCFTVRDEAWDQDDYAGALEALVSAGRIAELEDRLVPYISEDDSQCRLCTARVR